MNLGNVQAFIRVADDRSFTRAARSLHLPTSSISRAVARLEADLGAKLFERTTRHLALTTLGRAYYEHAARALAELAEGARRVGELQRDPWPGSPRRTRGSGSPACSRTGTSI